MKKTTELLNELNRTSNIDKYLKDNRDSLIDCTLANYLCKVFEERGLAKADVIRNSDVNEIYGYQILGGKRIPSRDKTICLCIGAEFSVDDTNLTLKVGGYAPLYAKSPRDSIIIYGIQKSYTVWQINEELFSHQLETL